MIIHREICVGCGQCQPFCPSGAIRFQDLKSAVDQEVCYECGNCLRVGVCPVDAIAESPHVYEMPRALRKFFSDPNATHAATLIEGRGTEESKTNDVTHRVGTAEVGVAIEVGRPTLGMELRDIQKITQALARNGFHDIEPNNPIQGMIENPETGELKRELLNERVLSAIIEMRLNRRELAGVLRIIREVSGQVDSVFTLDVCTVLEPGLTVPAEILEAIESQGFTCRPNAKINMGLGRASQ